MRRAAAIIAVAIVSGAFIGPATAAQADTSLSVTREGFSLDELRQPDMHSGKHGNHSGHSDFDGDGVDDLAVTAVAYGGQPFGAQSIDGIVAVTYSTSPYIDYFAPPSQDEAIDGGGFGTSMATGDFNHDGFDDLAIGFSWEGLPGADSESDFEAGAVWVIPGSLNGLNLAAAKHFNQNSPGVPGTSEAGDLFGGSVAAGDINADGYADLAVGAPGEAIGSVKQAGAVDVFYGSSAGLKNTGVQAFDQNTAGVPGSSEARDGFGYGLSIGHVTSKTYGDLVVTSPGEIADGQWSGSATVLRGSSSGLTTSGATNANGWSKVRESSDAAPFWSGKTVTTVDTNGDGYAEVLVGARDTQVNDTAVEAGAVLDFAGGTHGISNSSVRLISQDTSGVPGTAEDSDLFAAAIASGDVNGDGYGDLVVGAPGEAIGSVKEAGGIWVIYGSKSGLTGTGSKSYNQSSAGVAGTPEHSDRFGDAVAVLNLDGAGPLDVVAATPNERFGESDNSYGTIQLFTGASKGLTPTISLSALTYASVGTDLSQFGQSVAGGDDSIAKQTTGGI